MKQYTVIGFCDDSGLKCVSHHHAESPLQAACRAATIDGSICIVAVLEGKHDCVLDSGEYLDYSDDLLAMQEERLGEAEDV